MGDRGITDPVDILPRGEETIYLNAEGNIERVDVTDL